MKGIPLLRRQKQKLWLTEYVRQRLKVRVALSYDSKGDRELKLVFFQSEDFDKWQQVAEVPMLQVTTFIELIGDASKYVQTAVTKV